MGGEESSLASLFARLRCSRFREALLPRTPPSPGAQCRAAASRPCLQGAHGPARGADTAPPEGNAAGTGTGGRPRARGAPRKWGAAQAGRLHPQGVIDSPALPSATVPNASEAYACKRLRRRCQDSLSAGLCKAIPEKAVQGRRGWTAQGFSAATYFQTT